MASVDDNQFVAFASQLRNLLVAHERADTQLTLIEAYIADLTYRVFHSHLHGSHGTLLRLLTKKSIADGVRKAYKHYKQRKFQLIQELSAHILQQLQPEDDVFSTPTLQTPLEPLTESDELVSTVTDTFLVMSRSM